MITTNLHLSLLAVLGQVLTPLVPRPNLSVLDNIEVQLMSPIGSRAVSSLLVNGGQN